ncbi:hypothetical protein [Nocardia sp. NBC_00416]|uniref:hypothetical protein n=1 Tax=Nocardia sp. NBC_00416 TaxID=2975991 RepID=UPI002E20D703
MIAAEISVLYRNVVITMHDTHYTLGEKQITQPLLAMSIVASDKLSPATSAVPAEVRGSIGDL